MADSAPPLPDPAEEHVRQLMDPAVPDPLPTEPTAPIPTIEPQPVPAPAFAADPSTDQVVDEIANQDSDALLAAQDQAAGTAYVMKPRLHERFKNGIASWWDNPKKRYGTIGGLLLLIILLLAVPFTRYEILGLFLHKQVSVSVVDSSSGAPISGAIVDIAGRQAKSEASGTAKLPAKLGKMTVTVSKKYYKTVSQTDTITLSEQQNHFRVSLLALGRQVPVKVINKITGKPLADAVIKFQGGETKTDKSGLATVVLGSSDSSQKATVNVSGFNNAAVTIQAADGMVTANTFSLTPTGTLYFLSNLSGKIDVVKTNLDGTGRQTVLAGTGSEEPNSTSLLAARDWKYIALLAKRDNGPASLYLIDTTNGDKLTTIDQSDAAFTLVGWSGDTFVYTLARTSVQNWQPKAQALKSYDATSGRTTPLDETTAEGTSPTDYGYNNFSNIYLLDNELVYAKNWYSSFQTNHLNGKSDSLISIRPDGTGHRTIKDFPIPPNSPYYSVNLSLYQPYGVYVQVPNGTGNNYYEYENGSLSPKSDVTDATFNKPYPTYLISPSSSYTFWSEQRDGKNSLFLGDKTGANQKQIASLSDYKTYGWYSDDYLLISKNSSELYIQPHDGSGQPLKITDYYKPPITYNGYGGGYGGL